VCSEEVEERLGDSLRERARQLFDSVIDEVEPIAGAQELLEELKARGHVVVIATSSTGRHLDIHLDKLGIRDTVDGWTSKDDVDRSKPEPHLVHAALEKAGTRNAVMIGDSPWDVQAASAAGIPTLGVLSGGFCAAELKEALTVFPSVGELRTHLDVT
jgi:HAD superfamily hydrolase (TIGR01509 family)